MHWRGGAAISSRIMAIEPVIKSKRYLTDYGKWILLLEHFIKSKSVCVLVS